MCPQERLSLYKFSSLAYPLSKRIGTLANPQLSFYFTCLLPFCCLNQNNPKYLSFNVCSLSLFKLTHQYLLLLVGFDTLTYRKHYDRSLNLWVIGNIAKTFMLLCFKCYVDKEDNLMCYAYLNVYALYALHLSHHQLSVLSKPLLAKTLY